MARSLSETPDPTKIWEVYDSVDDPNEALKLLAAAYPNARADYLARLFDERAAAFGKEAQWRSYQISQFKAVRDFLKRGSYTNLADGGQALGLQPQELWNKIMREANLPLSEMPETFRVR